MTLVMAISCGRSIVGVVCCGDDGEEKESGKILTRRRESVDAWGGSGGLVGGRAWLVAVVVAAVESFEMYVREETDRTWQRLDVVRGSAAAGDRLEGDE